MANKILLWAMIALMLVLVGLLLYLQLFAQARRRPAVHARVCPRVPAPIAWPLVTYTRRTLTRSRAPTVAPHRRHHFLRLWRILTRSAVAVRGTPWSEEAIV